MKPNVIILVVGRGAQALLTVALFRVVTQYLSPSQIGGVYLMFSVSYLFTSFLINPVSTYIGRKLFSWYDEKNIFEHLSGYNYYVAFVSLLSFPLVWGLWRYFGVGGGLSGLIFSAEVSCYIYLLTWNVTFLPVLNALGHRVVFVLLTVSGAALGLLLSPLFVLYGDRSAEYWMAGQIAALGLVNLAGVRLFRKLVPEPSQVPPMKRYMGKETLSGVGAFAVPIAVSAFFMWAQGQSYRVIVENIAGAELLGYLGVGLSIATSVAGIMESLVQQIYLPGFYRKITGADKEGRGKALSDLAAQAIPVYVIYLFFIVGVSEFLVYFLVAEKYRAVFVYARYGAFVEFFRMSTNVLAAGAYSEMRTKALISPYFWGGVVAVTGVYFSTFSDNRDMLIPAALALSGLVTAVGMGISIRAMTPLSFNYFPLAKALCASALFLPLTFFHASGLWPSLYIVGVAGAYFSFLQYRAARKWINAAAFPSRTPSLARSGENVSVAEP